MAFITGSLTNADPGPALYALMAPALTTAGYTLVDTVVISTRTHKVWKSPAAGNAHNLDWYLDIGYTTTGAGTLSLTAFEYFDPATDLGYRGPYVTTGSVTPPDAATGTRWGASGFALESNWLGAQNTYTQMALTTTAFGYWISIDANRIISLNSGTPSVLSYAGFYLPDPIYAAKAGAALFPLVTGRVGGASYSNPSLAVHRFAPMTTAIDWDEITSCMHDVTGAYPSVGAGSTAMYPFTAHPISITSFASYNLGRFGWFRDVLVTNGGTVLRGDTCTVDGAQYVFCTAASNNTYLFKAS